MEGEKRIQEGGKVGQRWFNYLLSWNMYVNTATSFQHWERDTAYSCVLQHKDWTFLNRSIFSIIHRLSQQQVYKYVLEGKWKQEHSGEVLVWVTDTGSHTWQWGASQWVTRKSKGDQVHHLNLLCMKSFIKNWNGKKKKKKKNWDGFTSMVNGKLYHTAGKHCWT